MRLWVKICGITTVADALAAADAGADAVGFVFAASPRRVSLDQAADISRELPGSVERVGVFLDARFDEVARAVERARLDVVQLHGRVDVALTAPLRTLGCRVVRALRMRGEKDVAAAVSDDADVLLLDAYAPGQAGGTGRTFDWRLAAAVADGLRGRGRRVPIVVAGGLTPDNVAQAIRAARPAGVDVSSGVELAPGRKCPEKMRHFVRKVREVDGSYHIVSA